MVVNVQTSVSWAVGFAVPLAAFALALAIYLAGTPLYWRVPPGGSALTRIVQARRRRRCRSPVLHECPWLKAGGCCKWCCLKLPMLTRLLLHVLRDVGAVGFSGEVAAAAGAGGGAV